jgi:lysophosphatidate acyltransferase
LINRQSKKEARTTIEDQLPFLKQGVGIGITPEGTRNKVGRGLLPFKKGAFHLAIKAQVPIICLVVAPLAEVANWKNKKLRKARVPILVLPPVSTTGLTDSDVDKLISTVRHQMELAIVKLEKEIIYL